MNTEEINRVEYVKRVNSLSLNFENLETATEEFKRNTTRTIRTDLKNMYYTQKRPEIGVINDAMIFYRNQFFPVSLGIQQIFESFLELVPQISASGCYQIVKEELHGTIKFATYNWKADAPSTIADLMTFISDQNDVLDLNMVHLRLFSEKGSVRRSYCFSKLLETFEYLEDESAHKFGSDSLFESSVLCIDTEEFQLSYRAEMNYASVGKPNIGELYPQYKLTDAMTLSATNAKYNCFVNCIMLYARNNKIKFSVKDLQAKLPFDLTKEISTRDIEEMKSALDFPMQTQKYTNGVCSILLDDGHAYLIRDLTKTPPPSLIAKLEKQERTLDLYVCIDFETVFDETGKAVPYCMSLAVSTSIDHYDFSHPPGVGGRSAATSIDKYFPKKGEHSYWVGLCYGMRSECLRDFKKLVQKSFVKDNELNLHIWGFNNAKFDNMILLENYMQAKNTFRNIQITNNQYRCMEIYDHKIHDILYMLSPLSLEEHSKNFDCLPRKKADLVSHEAINEMYFTRSSDSSFLEDISSLKNFTTYTENDTLCLLSLMSRYAASANFVLKEYVPKFDWISNQHTAGSLAWHIFNKTHKYPLDALPKHWDDIVRDSFVGGRTQPFKLKPGAKKLKIRANTKSNYQIIEKMCGVDFCSLYPAMMRPSASALKIMGEDFRSYPVSSKLRQIHDLVVPATGCCLIRCDIDQSNVFHKIIAAKIAKDDMVQSLDWYADTVSNKWITNIEYFTLIEYGCKCNIYEVWEFEETAKDLFDAYVDLLFKHKMIQDILKDIASEKNPEKLILLRKDLVDAGGDVNDVYNPSLRAFIKLILNALSGKPAQQNYEDSTEFMTTDESKIRFVQDHKFGTIDFHEIAQHVCIATGIKRESYDRKKAKPSYLSMFIYAKARMYGYKVLIAPDIDQIYMDTDSMYFPLSQLEKHKQMFPGIYAGKSSEKLLGMLDIEHDDIIKMWVFGKKDYAYSKSNGKFDPKIKGINAKNTKPSWIRPQILSSTECDKREAMHMKSELFDKFRVTDTDCIYTYFGEFNDYSLALREQIQEDGTTKYFKCILFTEIKTISPETCDFRYKSHYVNLRAFSFRRHWRETKVTSLNIIKAIS